MNKHKSESIKTKVNMMLGRSSNNGENERAWTLTMTDVDSGVMVARVDLTDREFGRLVGCASFDVEAEVVRSELIGLKMETRRVRVHVGVFGSQRWDPDKFRTYVLSCVSGTDLEGWEPDIERRWNQHRCEGQTYEVTFRRWVEKGSKS